MARRAGQRQRAHCRQLGKRAFARARFIEAARRQARDGWAGVMIESLITNPSSRIPHPRIRESTNPRSLESTNPRIANREPRTANRERRTANRERRPRAARGRYVLSLCLLTLASGCAAHPAPALPDQFVSLNSHSLRLHFENRNAAPARPLLVYATGDGGMHRKDLETYRHLAALGDPIVGFDARDYVKHLGTQSATTTPERLAEDYTRIIERARGALGIDD